MIVDLREYARLKTQLAEQRAALIALGDVEQPNLGSNRRDAPDGPEHPGPGNQVTRSGAPNPTGKSAGADHRQSCGTKRPTNLVMRSGIVEHVSARAVAIRTQVSALRAGDCRNGTGDVAAGACWL